MCLLSFKMCRQQPFYAKPFKNESQHLTKLVMMGVNSLSNGNNTKSCMYMMRKYRGKIWSMGKGKAERNGWGVDLASEMWSFAERLPWRPNTLVGTAWQLQLAEGLKAIPLIKQNIEGGGFGAQNLLEETSRSMGDRAQMTNPHAQQVFLLWIILQKPWGRDRGSTLQKALGKDYCKPFWL